MKFEQLKVVSVQMDNSEHMLSIQEDCGQEDDPELSIAGLYNPTNKAKAYAQLFAVAPELLSLLIVARKELELYANDGGEDYNNPTLNDIIAKALGEQL